MKLRTTYSMAFILAILVFQSALVFGQSADGKSFFKMVDREDGCRVKLMKKMGWSINFFESSSKNHFDVHEGGPCDRDNWVSVMGHKDLNINVTYPNSTNYFNRDFFKQSIREVFKSRSSKCAYKHRYHEALKRGTTRIINNTHTKGLTFGIPAGGKKFCELPREWWKGTTFIKGQSDGYCFIPRSSNYNALKCLYTGRGQIECAAGLQLASLLAILELYNKEIDSCFSSKEIALGTWQQVGRSGHPVFSHVIDEMNEQSPRPGWGTQEFIGLTGYVGSAINDESLLDSERDRGENFIIVDSTKRASEDFAKRGLQYYSDISYRAWKLNREYHLKKSRGESQSKLSKLLAERDSLLSAPFLTDTIVYVHPLGYRSLSGHFQRLMVINPRMPYNLTFYGDTSNGYQYKRFIDYYMASCMKGNEI